MFRIQKNTKLCVQEGMATNFISLEHVNFAKSDVCFFSVSGNSDQSNFGGERKDCYENLIFKISVK